jgi:hypothetical protein
VRNDLAQIGMTLSSESIDPFEAFEDPTVKAALFVPLGWGRDYLSASNFFVGQFYGPVALAHGASPALVGASSDQLADWGYEVTEVPNVDSRIEACIPLIGAAQFECWAALDQYMMENVASFVPLGSGLVPVLTSRRVVGYSWDELATAPAYDRIKLSAAAAVGPDGTDGGTVDESPSSPRSTATPMDEIDPELGGLWETQRLTRDTIAATLEAAELDPGGAESHS